MKVRTEKNSKDYVESDCEIVFVEDSKGNRYEIKQDKFGGIEIMASDSLSIEPHVSNHITIKTI